MNTNDLQPSKEQTVKSIIAQYPYWFVWILREGEEASIVHLSSFKEIPSAVALQKVKHDLVTNENLQFPREIVQKLEYAQISVEEAIEMIMENLDDMTYEQSDLTE